MKPSDLCSYTPCSRFAKMSINCTSGHIPKGANLLLLLLALLPAEAVATDPRSTVLENTGELALTGPLG